MATPRQLRDVQDDAGTQEQVKRKREDDDQYVLEADEDADEESIDAKGGKNRKKLRTTGDFKRTLHRPQMRAHNKQTKLSSDTNLRTHSLSERVRKDAERIFAERESSEMQRVKNIIKDISIINHREATPQQQSASQKHVSSLFSAVVQPGRNFRADLQERKTKKRQEWWMLGVRDISTQEYRWIGAELLKSDCTRDTAEKICADLAILLNRWVSFFVCDTLFPCVNRLCSPLLWILYLPSNHRTLSTAGTLLNLQSGRLHRDMAAGGASL